MNYLSLVNGKGVNCVESIGSKHVHFRQDYKLSHWRAIDDPTAPVALYILGRPTIEVADWAGYTSAPNYITTLLLKRYQSSDSLAAFAASLNGAYTILIVSRRENVVHLILDRAGMFPVFVHAATDVKKVQFATQSGVLAGALNQVSLDRVSVAEFLRHGKVHSPNTYYNEIKALPSATCHSWYFETNRYHYSDYRGTVPELFTKVEDGVEAIAKSIEAATLRRTQSAYGPQAVLLSGGADSRAILCNAQTPLAAITLYNDHNTETRVASQIAAACQARHHLIRRDFDHYLSCIHQSVAASGGMSTFTNEHCLPVRKHPTVLAYDQLLSGCCFDYFFKGICLNLEFARVLGRPSPLSKIAAYQSIYYKGLDCPLQASYFAEVRLREEQRFADFSDLNDLECRRVLPLYAEQDGIMRQSLSRFFDWDLVAADAAVLDSFHRMPAAWKLNGYRFEQAIRRILPKKIADIPHANKGVPLGMHPQRYLTYCILRKIGRSFRRKTVGNRLAGEGSWIDLNTYFMQSEMVHDLWNRVEHEERSILSDILGYNPWLSSVPQILHQPGGAELFARLLTFAVWHRMWRESSLLQYAFS
ncbi:asparagine synthase-related protein [Coraliomargarita algicola]|uniref:asparagine synthase (glutamine-hydrolyzing) n=1 Tax=Coraliomargarita algicola TaxID=3092156 RepID=A0ABZ0RJ36_9BACT|nr:asparagine synthase-related protein [Coraliomargarita sp. J2-16]WPJ94990.1 asparagine synthase-related protein [Coraliomargarita sp. J2-16]